MKIGFIGDIVGKPGRFIIKEHLQVLRDKYSLDFVIANAENASHGFGLTVKNCEELLEYGIDVMTGGNHSFDKREIFKLFETHPLIRPINYPEATPGKGLYRTRIGNNEIAVINLMGYYTMPMVDNPFTKVVPVIASLKAEGVKHIIIDMHAEVSAEKNALLHLFRGDVSAILGTHTHVGTDDLQITSGCCYVTDVGLTGCRDGVIGMDKEVPIHRFLTGTGGHYDIPKNCKAIFQMIIFELNDEGRCIDAKKIKIYEEEAQVVTSAWLEE
ncbi:MAG: YmdB family metallophosphoesterase [Sulfurovum sp.]|nr:YmdB family metallophosphoesterase [Sulfurovum sp.]MCB4744436.1 YmdB family metallophosphoesterase [Sulfurovum sp.]MCB4745896.1 YmdB family metallophosphoesterase [Sulfurovum sp.]MCB4747590.1 YmdB family metallophosphoesterase [Sulfurovum sp.]MCB4748963.1 YmdB family metallophosphoesterase [Sulfurovum sp.]